MPWNQWPILVNPLGQLVLHSIWGFWKSFILCKGLDSKPLLSLKWVASNLQPMIIVSNQSPSKVNIRVGGILA